METSDLLNLFRINTQDIEYPGDGDDSDSLFKNDEIVEYIDFAQKEFARRTEVLKDARSSITQLTVSSGKEWVKVSNLIIAIKKARLINSGRRLKIINQRELDEGYLIDDYGLDWESTWENKTGTPQMIITDMDTNNIRLFPIPIEADKLALQVTRYPLNEITSEKDDLEIPDQYRRKLLHHMLYTAYGKQDADSFDPQKQNTERAMFEEAVEAARREVGKRYRKTGTTKYGGI